MATGISEPEAAAGRRVTSSAAHDDAPIGVFDSGLGGLSVLRELRRALPRADWIYVADSGYCPYGGREPKAILERACTITEFLLAQRARLIVVACNAATVAAAEYLRANYPSAFVGMEPAVKPAAAASRSGVIGVLTTTLTARGERLRRLVERHAAGVRVLMQPCPGLVEQVEIGDLDGVQTRALVAQYVDPLLAAGADVLVLGCTHYPFLRRVIAERAGSGVRLIDTGEAVARRTAELAGVQVSGGGELRCFTSGSTEIMQRVGGRLWGAPIHAAALPHH
ncbi:MAG: glutamate racemase [Gammaproteobacteria bacterium]|nr:glutamate racemase [Gammaproteobacteria bacterium]